MNQTDPTTPKPRARNPRTPAATMADLQRAIDELQIDVPILNARLLNGRLELHLYGGAIILWPPLPKI